MTNAYKVMLEQGISISSDANIVSYKTRPSIFLKHGILLGEAKTTMPKELSNVLKLDSLNVTQKQMEMMVLVILYCKRLEIKSSGN